MEGRSQPRASWRCRVIVAIAVALVPAAGAAHPVAATTTGGGTFEGTATLPAYPCGCLNGSFTGTAAITLAGASTVLLDGAPEPYTATWPDPRSPAPVNTNPTAPNLSATYGYTDDCLISGDVAPVLGTATGGFTLSGGLLIVGGTVWDNATLTGSFTWTRVGAVVDIFFVGLTLTGMSPTGTVAVNLSLNNTLLGQGVAGFVYTGPGTCTNQATNQTAQVVGGVFEPA